MKLDLLPQKEGHLLCHRDVGVFKPLTAPRIFLGPGHGGSAHISADVLVRQAAMDMIIEGYQPFHRTAEDLLRDVPRLGQKNVEANITPAWGSEQEVFSELVIPHENK